MSSVMMERRHEAACGMPGAMPMMGQMPGMAAMMPGMMMVPRCTMKMEKCAGGMKVTCICEDEVAAATLAELVQDDGRRHVQPVLHDERHDDLLLQHGHVQVRVRQHQGRRVHHLHQRRQGLLRDDPSLLRLRVRVHEVRLHVLRLLQRDALLLRSSSC